MTLQTIKFEYDIPDGYRFVRYGIPNKGELYLTGDGKVHEVKWNYSGDYIIVEKIPEEEQSSQNTKHHKHADLIHAWADGAQIQLKNDYDAWEDCAKCGPAWHEDHEYRIKPKNKTVRFRNYIDNENEVHVHHENECLYTFKDWIGDWQEVEVEE